MRICFNLEMLINIECCLICPWISPSLWLSLAMTVAKLLSGETMISAVPTCNASLVTFLTFSPCPGATMMVFVTLFPEKTLRDANNDHSIHKLLPLIHVECGCRGICPSAPPSTSTCQALARNWHPIGVAVVILPLSSCPQMETGKCFFSKLTKTSGTDVVNAAGCTPGG